MSPTRSWLAELTLAKLHGIAVSIGSACSGTKAVRVDGILHAISGPARAKAGDLSLLSIDMGIRNLAFAHITAPSHASKSLQYGLPTLRQWRQVAISRPSAVKDVDSRLMALDPHSHEIERTVSTLPQTKVKESFEPIDYAQHAYDLITYLLRTYKPSHILIERQRFRSGGRAAVPEWTIRVGVFEGMLYAVLRTLVEQGSVDVQVEPVQPTVVNRYWLEGGESGSPEQASAGKSATRRTGRDVKRAKIDLVGQMLGDEDRTPTVLVDQDLRPFTSEFVSIWQKDRRKNVLATNGISKLDDLADCLLQGIAWIDWQNRRRQIQVLGRDGVHDMSG